MPPKSAPAGALRVFTDGSCFGNGAARASGGYATVWPEHPQHDRGWPLKDGRTPTSNRAELAAWLAACTIADLIDPADTPAERRTLLVHTDSELLVKTAGGWVATWAKNGWTRAGGEPVANEDLCRLVHAQLQRRAVRTVHVRAHTGRDDPDSAHNAAADALAREAARTQMDAVSAPQQTLPPNPFTGTAAPAATRKRSVGPPPRAPRRPEKRARVVADRVTRRTS